MSNIRGKDSKDKKAKSYAEENDFRHISIAKLPLQIELAYHARQPINVVGDSGIGKTAMVNQAGLSLGEHFGEEFKVTTLIVSQLVPEDLMGIPMPDAEKKFVKFLKMACLPTEGRGILFLDEWNQADPSVQKPLFQLLGEGRIGDYVLPEGWSVVAACNPDGGVYRTTPPTPAFRRRLSWFEVQFDHKAFIDYIETSGWNEVLIDFLRRRPEMCYNKSSEQANRVFANPASWDKCNTFMSLLKATDSFGNISTLCAGLVGWGYWKEFSNYFKKHGNLVDPREVLTNYPKVRKSVQALSTKGKVGQLAQICAALITYMLDIEPGSDDFKKYSDNIAKFYFDLLDDTAVMFVKEIEEKFNENGKQDAARKWTMVFANNPESLAKMIKLTSTYITSHKEKQKQSKKK